MGPFGRDEKTNVQSASEVSDYSIKSSDGDVVVVAKTYRLYTPPTGDNPAFEMVGQGTWSFNTKENVPQDCNMSLKLDVAKDNTKTTIPISVKYKRLSAEKIAEMDAAAKKKAEEIAKAAAEKKAFAAEPLTAAEKREMLATLASNDADKIRASLDFLAGKSLADPDPEIASAIEKHLASSDRRVADAATKAMSKWSPAYAMRKKLENDYRGPSPLKSSDLVVESTTPLYVGQFVQAQQPRRGSFWRAAIVKQLLPDGQVELAFLTFGKERDTAVVSRRNIQLAPPELVQPNKPASTAARSATMAGNTAGGKTRTWTDATGQFKVDAEFVSIADGTVNLRRQDGRTMSIPLEKLSEADRAHVKVLQEQENPFKLN